MIAGTVFIIAAIIGVIRAFQPCVPLSFGFDSVVCRCNITYCDTVPDISGEDHLVIAMSSSQAGLRLNVTKTAWQRTNQRIQDEDSYDPGRDSLNSILRQQRIQLVVDSAVYRQTVEGFGGAFTDSAGINIAKLPIAMQKSLLESYYHKHVGIGYTMARVPIGGCDFSTRPYTYVDTPHDRNLNTFQLASEDIQYKLPYLKLAKQMMAANRKLKVVASPWSAPAWMKTNGRLNGKGGLQKEYYSTWAQYLAKFLKSYSQQGVPIWALTTQNEPVDGIVPNFPFNCMSWTPQEQAKWVHNNLSPELNRLQTKFNISKPLLFVMDDQRYELPYWTNNFFRNKQAAAEVSGIALHWYGDPFYPAAALDDAHARLPDKVLLNTEACEGSMFWQINKVELGSWQRAENYAKDIIKDLNHWVSGWIDWNIALDMNGGPNWVDNFVDSPIIVDRELDQFYKQPTYYVMAHFAMFIPPGSSIVEVPEETLATASVNGVALTVADTEEGDRVVVLLNINDHAISIRLVISNRFLDLNLEPKSINSLKWKIQV